MAFELERILYATEDFLRRNLRSRTAREAQKRKARRKLEEGLRRLRRAGFLFVGLLAALVLASILVDVGLLTWLMAIPTALLVALASLAWPTRRARPAAVGQGPELPLDELAARAEEGLLDRCDELPGRALPAADAIVAHLHEFQPHAAALDPDATLAGDARRLIGQHLPKLVDTYLALPPSLREPGSEAAERLTESLGIVADELGRLLETCCRDRQLGFETQRRFIEARYRDDDRLSGG